MMIFQPLITNEQTNICLDFEKKIQGFAGWRNEQIQGFAGWRFCGLKKWKIHGFAGWRLKKKNEILLRVHEFFKITHEINYMYLKYFLKHIYYWLNIV